jgi:hypothetical protein
MSDTSNKSAETEAAKFAVRIHLFSLLFEVTYFADTLINIVLSGYDALKMRKRLPVIGKINSK